MSDSRIFAMQLKWQGPITIVLIWLFFWSPVISAELNAPIEQKMTIGSEMHRKSNIIFDCSGSLHKGGPPAPWPDFIDCIHRVTSEEIRKNMFTEPFQLGLYSGAYMNLQIIRSVAQG